MGLSKSAGRKEKVKKWLKKHVLSEPESVVYYVVAFLLFLIAMVVVYKAAFELANAFSAALNPNGALGLHGDFPEDLPKAINNALLAVIVLEILKTIRESITKQDDWKLAEAFLVVGIVASVRRVLTIGAQLSFEGLRAGDEVGAPLVNSRTIELAVDTSIVVVFVMSLVLLRRNKGDELKSGLTNRRDRPSKSAPSR
jgi:uncharacterized membrane protein (DUF373 family)